jgi:hypothetical protein
MMFRPPPDDPTQQFLFHMKKNEPQRAAAILSRLAADSDWLALGAFRPLFRSAQRHVDVFLDALLADEQTTFGHLSLAAKALETGWKAGRLPEVRARIAALAASGRLPPTRFGISDLLGLHRAGGAPVFVDLARLKYSGATLPIRLDETVPLAARLSSRLTLTTALLERLYSNSRFRELGREEWERRLRTAFCVDHITSDAGQLIPHFTQKKIPLEGNRSLDVLIDLDAAKAAFAQLKSSQGALFVLLHGGFTGLVISTFRRMKNGVIVGRGAAGRPATPNYIGTDTDPRTALFQMMRAIEDGKSVLVAPDALIGTMASSMQVLGSNVPMADGTPFIAFESGCETVWISMQRKGDFFTPNLVPGPVRSGGEGFKSFKQRRLDFYAGEVEGLLRGDPINLAVRPGRWAMFLNAPIEQDGTRSATR